MIAEENCALAFEKHRYKMKWPLEFAGATGPFQCTEAMMLTINAVKPKANITALVASKGAPSMLAAGEMNSIGYTYIWLPWLNPAIVDTGGRVTPLEVPNGMSIPCWRHDQNMQQTRSDSGTLRILDFRCLCF